MGPAIGELAEVGAQRGVGGQSGEALREEGGVAGCQQLDVEALGGAETAGGQLLEAGVEGVEGAEGGQQLGGGLAADAGNAGDVVNGIAGPGEQVDDLSGTDAD